MGKSGPAEKVAVEKKDAPAAAPAAQGAAHAHHGPTFDQGKKKSKHDPGVDGCHSWACKGKAQRFNFCNEHYDQFKFGLIKKTGEPVSDFEKKFEHYQAHKARVGVQKAA